MYERCAMPRPWLAAARFRTGSADSSRAAPAQPLVERPRATPDERCVLSRVLGQRVLRASLKWSVITSPLDGRPVKRKATAPALFSAQACLTCRATARALPAEARGYLCRLQNRVVPRTPAAQR